MRGKRRTRYAVLGTIATASAIPLIVVLGLWNEACRKSVKVVVAPIPDVSTIQIDPKFCEKNPARCELLCAGCPDKAKCFTSGGECGAPPPLLGSIQDQKDRGPDIWVPGCHFVYPQDGCLGQGRAWAGDWCHDDGVQINEWFMRTCHDGQADHYLDDCDKKCRQIGLGAGKCVTDKAFCTTTIDSAHCVCEDGSPVPPSPQNPT